MHFAGLTNVLVTVCTSLSAELLAQPEPGGFRQMVEHDFLTGALPFQFVPLVFDLTVAQQGYSANSVS